MSGTLFRERAAGNLQRFEYANSRTPLLEVQEVSLFSLSYCSENAGALLERIIANSCPPSPIVEIPPFPIFTQ